MRAPVRGRRVAAPVGRARTGHRTTPTAQGTGTAARRDRLPERADDRRTVVNRYSRLAINIMFYLNVLYNMLTICTVSDSRVTVHTATQV